MLTALAAALSGTNPLHSVVAVGVREKLCISQPPSSPPLLAPPPPTKTVVVARTFEVAVASQASIVRTTLVGRSDFAKK